MKYQVSYYRVVGDLSELARIETFECPSKTAATKHIRETKKKLASDCVYRFPRDVMRVVVKELE